MKLTERAEFLIDNLDLPVASGVDDARWEHFQIAHLCDDGTFRIENKSRQIAWSFLVAAEGVANACLYATSSLYQSINLDEAQEKIRYAMDVYQNLQIAGLPKITKESSLRLEFDNGARIISAPGRPQRGKARFWVYPDEWAHQQHARENYTAMLPILSKGGKLRGGSSPMGASGIFWEIFTEAMQKYPGYTRKATPWWEVQSFCEDVKTAHKIAPSLDTHERVTRFGSERLQVIFANMPLEDFQQEYECSFIDESSAWITWNEIKNAQQAGADLWCLISSSKDGMIDGALRAIDRIAGAEIEKVLAAGVDVGRTRNTTELFVVGMSPAGTYPLRAAITLDNCDFDKQLDVLSYALTKLRIAKMEIDRNGIGRNLSESLEKRFPAKAIGVNFTNETKKLWATDAKMLIQQNKTPLPQDRNVAYQIHSIKRLVTGNNNLVFDTERNEKHHADKFWAWVLALDATGHNVTQYGKPGVVKYA